MSRLAKGVATLVVGMSLAFTTVHAQGAEFSLGGGVDLPLGDFGDGTNTGFHGTAAVSFLPSGSPVGIEVDGNYARFGTDLDDFNIQMIYGTGNVVYKFQTAEDSKFHPYIIGGGGVYNLDPTGDAAAGQDGVTKFGINAGAGFDFRAGAAGLFVEGRFHNVFTEGSNSTFIPITVGVRFGGSGA